MGVHSLVTPIFVVLWNFMCRLSSTAKALEAHYLVSPYKPNIDTRAKERRPYNFGNTVCEVETTVSARPVISTPSMFTSDTHQWNVECQMESFNYWSCRIRQLHNPLSFDMGLACGERMRGKNARGMLLFSVFVSLKDPKRLPVPIVEKQRRDTGSNIQS